MKTATALAQTMKYVPIDAVMKHKARIAGKLADAVGAFRIATAKLGAAVKEEDGSDEKTELREALYTAEFFADMLETGNETPSLPSRVFRAIGRHVNQHPDNLPHIEGAIIALKLAERSLEAALKLGGQLSGEEIDERYHQPFAALGTVRQYVATLQCGAYVFDVDDALGAILKMPRTLALVA